MIVWTPRLRPLGVYHLIAAYPRTGCGMPKPNGYGYTVNVGDALALSMTPCPRCFTPPAAGRHRGESDASASRGPARP